MSPEEKAAIRERAEWPHTTRTSGTDSNQAFLDRRALLAEVDRLNAVIDHIRENYHQEMRGMERDHRAEIAGIHADHAREMNEAGAELRAMERNLDRAEQERERW